MWQRAHEHWLQLLHRHGHGHLVVIRLSHWQFISEKIASVFAAHMTSFIALILALEFCLAMALTHSHVVVPLGELAAYAANVWFVAGWPVSASLLLAVLLTRSSAPAINSPEASRMVVPFAISISYWIWIGCVGSAHTQDSPLAPSVCNLAITAAAALSPILLWTVLFTKTSGHRRFVAALGSLHLWLHLSFVLVCVILLGDGGF